MLHALNIHCSFITNQNKQSVGKPIFFVISPSLGVAIRQNTYPCISENYPTVQKNGQDFLDIQAETSLGNCNFFL